MTSPLPPVRADRADTTIDPAAARARARIILVRHGETEWSRIGRHTSTTDLALTAVGEEQARGVGAALHGREFGLVLVSPLQRARQTAALAGYGDPEIDGDLTEWDYGAYEGLTSPAIVQMLGRDWNLWDDGVPAGDDGRSAGESAIEVQARVGRVVGRMLPALDRGDDVLVVAHGHVLRALAAAWMGLGARGGAGFSLGTGSVGELGFEHEHRVVFRWNCPPAALLSSG